MRQVSLERLVRELAAAATAGGQRFLVARNYQLLPRQNVGRDIDVLVSPSRLRPWVRLTRVVSHGLGLRHESVRLHHYCCRQIISGLTGGSVDIDLIPHLDWRGVTWLSVDDVIRRATRFRNEIWIPHPADECVITFCHSYLYGGRVKEKYLPLMAIQAKGHADLVLQRLEGVFGVSVAGKLLDLLRDRDLRGLRRHAPRYRARALLRGFLRRPLRFAFAFARSYLADWHGHRLQARLDGGAACQVRRQNRATCDSADKLRTSSSRAQA
jgi:hypothetical protein